MTPNNKVKLHPNRLSVPKHRIITILILIVACQNIIIYKLVTSGDVERLELSGLMESMMNSPREVASVMRKANHRDVIVYLTQFSQVHSSYGAQLDATGKNTTGLTKFKRSLDLLNTNYLSQYPCEVIIFHDSTSRPTPEIQTELRTNFPQLQFHELNDTWWDLPYGLEASQLHKWKRPKYSIGYRHMIRFFAILIWPYLEKMGYTHVMRMDDDSFIHSRIEYNIFDYMRENGRRYGFRQPVRDSAVGKGYDIVVKDYLNAHPNSTTHELIDQYNNISKRVGFYNNFFVAEISFFTNEPVKSLLKAIDESKLIYTERTGDLVIHSTVVRLFAQSEQIQWFRDFTYEHMTLCRMDICGAVKDRINYKGCPVNGGVSRGLGMYTDDEWTKFATNIKRQFNTSCEVEIDWNFIGADDSVRDCEVKKREGCWDFLSTLPSKIGKLQRDDRGWK